MFVAQYAFEQSCEDLINVEMVAISTGLVKKLINRRADTVGNNDVWSAP